MTNHPASPQELFSSAWRNRELIAALIKREVIVRYRGSILGILWSFFYPLIMLSVYTFVFSVVFKARWNTGSESRAEFALMLFAGLLIYNFFAECIIKAPQSILENVNYVKKIVFPLEILALVSVGTALFHAVVSILVWLAAYTALFGLPHLTALCVPVVLLPLVLFTCGCCWMLASLGVYVRDITQFIGVLTGMLMFLSPIFYPASALPNPYNMLLMVNPLTLIIEHTRNALYVGKGPDMLTLLIQMSVSLVVAWLGFAWFQKTRKGFADVI